MHRAAPILAAVFAAGLVLGLVTNTIYLAMGSSDLRATMESRLADQPGPLGSLVLERIDETGVVDDFAADARAGQIRLVVVAALLGTAGATFASRSLAGWTLERPPPVQTNPTSDTMSTSAGPS